MDEQVRSTDYDARAIRALIEAAKDAADWLCEAAVGSDPRERGEDLRAALANVGRQP